jgi:hypothetical protein
MPPTTLNAKLLTSKARFFKFFLLATSYLLLTTILSGCNVVGSNKPAALQVTSTPEASVFLDGKHLGKTPFFSDQLKAGEYLLKITVSEASFVDKITLTSNTLTVVNRELNNNFLAQSGETLWLKPESKGLFIASIPQEADLTIDGKSFGKTPILIEKIEDGEHKVVLSKVTYIDREFSIKTSSKYQLVADVTLASEIAKNFETNPSPAPAPKVEKVEILKTPQGFLRVRAEASLDAPEVGRVKTGDQLEVIQETKDWIKVQFEGKFGWISAQYTKKL